MRKWLIDALNERLYAIQQDNNYRFAYREDKLYFLQQKYSLRKPYTGDNLIKHYPLSQCVLNKFQDITLTASDISCQNISFFAIINLIISNDIRAALF